MSTDRGTRSRWRTVVLSLFGAGCVSVVAQSQPGRFDILTGARGEGSCQLKDLIYDTCRSIPPALNATQTPSECTCNKVFFNIWSACSYASGNNTLPLYGSWTSLCTANTVSLDDSQRKANEGSLGIVNPAWANIDVPGGGAFDLQKAVTLSMQSMTKRWSTLQVILPIISSAATAILVVIFMAIYQRYLSRVHWKAKVAELIRPVPKVKPVDAGILDRAWEIEPNAPTETNESFVFVDMPSPVEPVSSRPRHYSDSSSEASQQDQALVPGGRVWPESFTGGTQQYQPLLLPIHDHSEDPENAQASSSSGKWRLPMKSMTMPWKKRPAKIREAAPTRRFDIYDYDHSSPSTSSKRSTFGSSGEQTQSRSDGARASRVSTIHEVSEDSRSSMNASYLEDDESSGLIANSRRYSGSVLVIGHDNRYSTAGTNMTNDTNMTSAINSYIGIVSPTATGSSYSPRNTLQLAKGKAPVITPTIPPPPTLAPPNPPAIQRKASPRKLGNATELTTYAKTTLSPPMLSIQGQEVFVPNPGVRYSLPPSSPSHFRSSSMNDLEDTLRWPMDELELSDSATSTEPPKSNYLQPTSHQRSVSHSIVSPSPAPAGPSVPRTLTPLSDIQYLKPENPSRGPARTPSPRPLPLPTLSPSPSPSLSPPISAQPSNSPNRPVQRQRSVSSMTSPRARHAVVVDNSDFDDIYGSPLLSPVMDMSRFNLAPEPLQPPRSGSATPRSAGSATNYIVPDPTI